MTEEPIRSRLQAYHSTFPRVRPPGNNEASRRARWTMYEGESSERPENHLRPAPAVLRRSSLSKQIETAGPSETPDHAEISDGETLVTSPSSSPRVPSNADYVIAVVGHDGVGKSTVIRRAIKTWSGSTPVTTYTSGGHAITSSLAQIKAGGKLPHDCKVEFVEVNLRALDLSGVSQVWPTAMSPVSGAILCYDAERQDTLRGLSEALHLLCPALPMVLFACKSDPDKKLQVDAQVGDSIGQPYNVGLIEVTTATPQGKHKMRTGLRWLLYRLEERQRRSQRHLNESSPKPQKDGEADGAVKHSPWRHRDDLSESSSYLWSHNSVTASTATSTVGSINGSPSLDSDMASPRMPTTPNEPDAQGYTSLPELMNRLFTAIVSTENDQFVQAFFMTYRRFCQPLELMTEFYDRFVEVEQYAVSRDIRLWALMKLSGALLTWTSDYPGDLFSPETQALFRETLKCMIKYPFLAHITQDLAAIERTLDEVVDLDQSWSCQPATPNPAKSSPHPSTELKEDAHDNEEHLDDGDQVKPKSAASLNEPEVKVGRPLSSDRATQSDRATTDSSSDLSQSVYSGDNVGHQRWSAAMQLLLRMDHQVFAVELTRMQWELFSSIRARDVLRHDIGKERDDPVGRSIEFFNHLSRWVSTMILAHPKAKTRAKIYEAFVKVAVQLRRLNNYDSLCAVISGLKETSVHRLSQTQALVRLEHILGRDFLSHQRLMDPRNSYQHYRRALHADSTYGHTAIPLLTNVLSLTSRLQSGRSEDRRTEDGFVQWGKFARFGEILSVIPDFQSRGAVVPGHPSVSFRRLIEATPVIANEDGLYERSKLLEPGGSHAVPVPAGGGMLRKLANLAL